MTCKDCINYDWCKDQAGNTGYYNGLSVENMCKGFKDKSQYIKLPCKVWDTVYVKMQFGGYAEAEVRDYTYFITHGFCVVLTSKKFDKQNIPFSEFGKTVFLTREEAEKALREREANDK